MIDTGYRPSEVYFKSLRFFYKPSVDPKINFQPNLVKSFYCFSIRTVVNKGKICVLNLQPCSLPSIHQSDLKPYVVFLTPASPQMSKLQANKHGQIFKVFFSNDIPTKYSC